jgi:hypothetical protein
LSAPSAISGGPSTSTHGVGEQGGRDGVPEKSPGHPTLAITFWKEHGEQETIGLRYSSASPVGGLGATTLIEKGPPLFKLNGKVQPNLSHMSKFLAGKWR